MGLALVCPITSREKGYPFEVILPAGLKASGVVLSDQLKSVDWRARGSRFLCRVPDAVTAEALDKLAALLG